MSKVFILCLDLFFIILAIKDRGEQKEEEADCKESYAYYVVNNDSWLVQIPNESSVTRD